MKKLLCPLAKNLISQVFCLVLLLITEVCFSQSNSTKDTDSDGINNSIDLDDDNDGMLDVVELGCDSSARTQSWTTISPGVLEALIPGGKVRVTLDNYETIWDSFAPSNKNMDATCSSFSSPGIVGSAALSIVIANNQGDSNGTFTLDFFDENNNPVEALNPILHISRLGGSINGVITTSKWVLQNGLTHKKLAGDKILSSSIDFKHENHTENSTQGISDCSQGAAFGSFQIQSTTTKVVYNVAQLGKNLSENQFAADGVLIIIEACLLKDTDNDGISNHLDLDSDGDGCSDAIEGGANFVNGNLETSSLDGGNTGGSFSGVSGTSPVQTNLGNTVNTTVGSASYGVPTTAGVGQEIGTSQNKDSSDVCTDTDGDGINDVVDLDDDNDGILDAVELGCDSSARTQSWTTISPGVLEASIPGGKVRVTLDNYENFWDSFAPYNRNMDATCSSFSSPGIGGSAALGILIANEQGDSNGTFTLDFFDEQNNPIAAVNPILHISRLGASIEGVVSTSRWALQNGLTHKKLAGDKVLVSSTDFMHLDHTKTTSQNLLNCSGGAAFGSFQIEKTTSKVVYNVAQLGVNLTENQAAIDGVLIIIEACLLKDTDNDGISNHLDLDSDGDGCSDAIEGGANFVNGNLETSSLDGGNTGGSFSGVSGTSPVQTNLGNTVNTTVGSASYGVPTTAVVGQEIGTSQNKDSSDACTDTDGDGINDAVDLDDDNDGILDAVELGCDSSARTQSWTTISPGVLEASIPGGKVRVTLGNYENFWDSFAPSNKTMDATCSSFSSPGIGGSAALGILTANKQGDSNGTFTLDFFDEQNNPVAAVNPILHISRLGGSLEGVVSTSRWALQNGLTHKKLVGDKVLVSSTDFMHVDHTKTTSQNILNCSGGAAFGSFQIEKTTSKVVYNVAQLGKNLSENQAAVDGVLIIIEACLLKDTDNDGIPNHLDLDSDGDGCSDVLEAGFTDQNNDGVLGNSPSTVDGDGLVTGTTKVDGYTTPNDGDNNGVADYLQSVDAPVITLQPTDKTIPEGTNTSFSVNATGTGLTYQWELSTDGGATFNDISDNTVYSNTNTTTLNITAPTKSMNGYQYRIHTTSIIYLCGSFSDVAVLNVPDGFTCNSYFYQYYSNGTDNILARLNPATGSYDEVSNLGAAINLNGLGFYTANGFMYGARVSSTSGERTLFAIDGAGNLIDLGASLGVNITGGDVASVSGMYYGFATADNTIVKVDLGSLAVATSSITLPDVSDWVYVASANKFYGVVASSGALATYDPVADTVSEQTLTGDSTTAGTGDFGAVWASADDIVYAYKNDTGKIYQINTTTLKTTTIISSTSGLSLNDGVSCPAAVASYTDYGDAPDSYGSLEGSNGAKHTIKDGLFLGAKIDHDADAQVSVTAIGDDTDSEGNDDDGVQVKATSLQDQTLFMGRTTTFAITATGSGNISAWADWNANGSFDTGEQIVTDFSAVTGVNTIAVLVPAKAVSGNTYLRFRFTTATGITAVGAAIDGEVEDYRVRVKIVTVITNRRITRRVKKQ